MISINQSGIHRFLNSFFRLYTATVTQVTIRGSMVSGFADWADDDEMQEFKWVLPFSETDLADLTAACDFLHQHRLINGDQIIVEENILMQRMVESGWTPAMAKRTIDLLCSFAIPMVDNGVETDSFYVHF